MGTHPLKVLNIEELLSHYKVDSSGKIFSLRKGRYLKPHLNNSGYLQACLTFSKVSKFWLVHRVVATLYVKNPNNLPFVNHINGDKTDNRAENLEWCSKRDNQLHAIKEGLQKVVRGEHNGRYKHPQEKVDFVFKLKEKGYKVGEISKIVGASRPWVSNVLLKKRRNTLIGV